jgi:single-stranded-DNA-specific exonuclease
MAAGLTVERRRLEEVASFLSQVLKVLASAARARAGLELDGALTPQGVNDELIDLIDKAGPYGQGNPQPRFAFPAHRVKFAKVVGQVHVRCVLEAGDGSKLDGVAFRAADQPLGELLLGSGGMPLHVAGSLKRDSWGGREKIELLIDDAADPRRQP